MRESGIQCDVDSLPELHVKEEPTTVYLTPTRGYNDDPNPLVTGDFVPQTREAYYNTVRPQQVIFRIAQLIVEDLISGATGPGADAAKAAKAKGLARHQIFPEVVKILQQYVERKVHFAPGVDVRELALERYANQVRERVRDGITAAVATQGPSPPAGHQPLSSRLSPPTASRIRRPGRSHALTKSHLNAAIVRSEDERKAIDVLEDLDVRRVLHAEQPQDRHDHPLPLRRCPASIRAGLRRPIARRQDAGDRDQGLAGLFMATMRTWSRRRALRREVG